MLRKRLITKVLAVCLSAAMLAGCASGADGAKGDESSVGQEGDEAAGQAEDGNAAESARGSEDDLFVEAIPDLPDDFIKGMDASSVLVEENSGVKYYNFEGQEADVFEVLSDAGINYIRLRVWNDPYDADGNGYGGGNNDVATAIELGKRASKYGMKVCVDFHYSDFWADPKRQHAPKAWENMHIDEKSTLLYDYTVESLSKMLDEGVDVGMVQVGNEINNGMAGETPLKNVTHLLREGCKAVREVSDKYKKDIAVAIHYTNIESKGQVNDLVKNLVNNDVDFDCIGLSYYPFWDGSFDNMQSMVKVIQKNYGKKVFIAETSYCYTSEDGDGSENSLKGTDDIVDGYPATVQGQANMIRDIYASASEAGAEGVFYWEGTWIPVGSADQDNSAIWEKYGSGWASSYAAEYDPDDAGLYYGGCSWDNQALFDFEGYPLESLKVFSLMKEGSDATLRVDQIPDIYETISVGEEVTLPETVSVIYNNPNIKDEASVIWNEQEIAKVDNTREGTYKVTGKITAASSGSAEASGSNAGTSASVPEISGQVTCYVEVKLENHVLNPGFEDNDISMWEVSYNGASNPTDFQQKQDDAHTGDFSFHFWSGDEDMDFTIKQKITGLDNGVYELSCFAQGGDVDKSAKMELFYETNSSKADENAADFMVTSWADWQNPVIKNIEVTDGTITVGVHIKSNVNSWGTVDDFVLKKVAD